MHSQQTFEFHYGKHHQAYVTNLNNQIKGKDLENQSIEEVGAWAGPHHAHWQFSSGNSRGMQTLV
jgi:superoxide dismutase